MESTDKSYEEGNPQDLFDEVDDLLNNGRCLDAYNLLESRSASSTEKLGWLYRAALACYNKGCSEDVDNSRLQWLQKAHDHALEAHDIEPTDVDVLSVLCSSTGKLAEDSCMLDKVKYGFEFQKYLDKAISICADSYEFLHMRGRFQYQVSTLGTMEKTMAKALGSLPNASLERALEDLLAANNVSSDEIENIFFIGKTYDTMGDYKNAKTYLSKVLMMSRDPECMVEREYVEEAKEILNGENYS